MLSDEGKEEELDRGLAPNTHKGNNHYPTLYRRSPQQQIGGARGKRVANIDPNLSTSTPLPILPATGRIDSRMFINPKSPGNSAASRSLVH
jgi:hypothetical protein